MENGYPTDFSPFEESQQSNGLADHSRYARIETRTSKRADGLEVLHLKRRFIPKSNDLSVIRLHKLKQGERLDHIANQHFNNPELDWMICDANGAMHPDELLEEVGRMLRIPEEFDDGGVGDA